jgi:hypothetical protein
MERIWAYHSSLEQRVRDASPGFGWLNAIMFASLPWVLAFLPAIAVGAFTSAPFWLELLLWAVPMVIWLFVQLTMLAEIARIQRERR